ERARYDCPVTDKRPGLRKAGTAELIRARTLTLWRSTDYPLGELLESADVMSEGGLREDNGLQRYYGTTTLLLPLRSAGGYIRDADHSSAALLVALDPHVRLRAIRIAAREARVRGPHLLGTILSEVSVTTVANGVLMKVEVEAAVESDAFVV